jgi:DnaJ-class molecular chaperone
LDDELCPSCRGTGYAYERVNGGVPGDYSEREVSCSRCRGTGLYKFKPVASGVRMTEEQVGELALAAVRKLRTHVSNNK